MLWVFKEECVPALLVGKRGTEIKGQGVGMVPSPWILNLRCLKRWFVNEHCLCSEWCSCYFSKFVVLPYGKHAETEELSNSNQFSEVWEQLVINAN